MFGRRRPSPPKLKPLEAPNIVIDSKYIAIKEWDRQYYKWLMQDGERPGEHPEPDHEWNTNPEKYIFNTEDDESQNLHNDNE